MEQETFVFKLSQELEYSKAGDFAKTATLELRAPGMSEYNETMDLSQYVMRALIDSSRDLSVDEKQAALEARDATTEKMTGEEIIPALLSSKTVRFTDTADSFKALLPKICTVDGSISLSKDLINKLDLKDFTKLLGEFVANFIVPSLI